jgi:hypothetical protein
MSDNKRKKSCRSVGLVHLEPPITTNAQQAEGTHKKPEAPAAPTAYGEDGRNSL